MRIPLAILACLLLAGCGGSYKHPAPAVRETLVIEGGPVAPSGFVLGASYISALNQICYEAYPENGLPSQAQALCHGADGWRLYPDIYSNLFAGE